MGASIAAIVGSTAFESAAATTAIAIGSEALMSPGKGSINIPPPPGAAMVDNAGSTAAAAQRRRQAVAGGLNSTIGAGAGGQGVSGGATSGAKGLLGQ